MTTPTPDNLDALLRKVQALIATADDPATTPEAAENYRAKAEGLMFKYRIDESMMNMRGTTQNAGGVSPVWRTIHVAPVDNEFYSTYAFMAAQAVSHVGGKAVRTTAHYEGRTWWVLEAVGYESDLRYAEVIFTAMSLGFAGKMEPKHNPALGDAENAYVMRSAGWTGGQIARTLWARDDKAARSKARRLFAQVAEQKGEDASVLLGQGNSVEVYRASYADGFENEMWSRLARMRMSTGDEGAVVLKSRAENVLEAYYERYPHLRPSATPAAERSLGHNGGPGGNCPKCRAAKSGYCREHNYLRPRVGQYRERRVNAAGYSRGVVAAQSVDISSGGKGRVQGNDTRAIG